MNKLLINFQVRAKNKVFWVTFIPAVCLAIQAIAMLFGFELNLSTISDRLIDVVNSIFAMLTIAGVVVDHTTPGINDGEMGLSYTSPGICENIENDEEECDRRNKQWQ